jgi:hypothetical protein
VIVGLPKAAPSSRHRFPVEHVLEDAAHLVGAARVARDDRYELLPAALGRITRVRHRRRLPDVLREVREEAAQLPEGVVLVRGDVVDRPGASLLPCPTELLLVGGLAEARHRHDRRPGHEQLGRPVHDHREVRADDAGGAQARSGAEGGRHDGDDRLVLDHEVEARQRRHVREAHLLERLDRAAASRAVDKPHERQAQVVREPLRVDGLLPDRRVRRPAADREVVALDDGARPSIRPWPITVLAGRKSLRLPSSP